jgi:hypothetical protein
MLLSKTELDLARLAPKKNEGYRSGLDMIAVEKEETVVTNGHYLVRVTHGERSDVDYPVTPGLEHAQPNGKPILVSRDAALAAGKALPKKNTIAVLGNAALGKDGKVYVNDLENVSSFSSGEVSATFPNWKAVLPAKDKKPTCVFGVSAAYLRLLADFVEKHGEGRNPNITVTVYDPQSALTFQAKGTDGQDILAVLMPVRLG